MTWGLEVGPEFKRDYRKRSGEDAAFRQAVDKKVAQIRENPLHYKPLRKPMHGLRRAHVMSTFVLVFEPIEDRKVVRFYRLAHHDEAYGM